MENRKNHGFSYGKSPQIEQQKPITGRPLKKPRPHRRCPKPRSPRPRA